MRTHLNYELFLSAIFGGAAVSAAFVFDVASQERSLSGRELFEMNCASCHGDDGKDGWAAALNNGDFLAAATDGFLQATIVRGQDANGMPAFGDDLSGPQINNIVAFLRTWALSGHKPIEATRAQEKTTPTEGTR